VKLIEEVLCSEQKHEIIEKLTDAMVEIEAENMRPVTWVVAEEVTGGDWGIGGKPLATIAAHPRDQSAEYRWLGTAARQLLSSEEARDGIVGVTADTSARS
jgi:4-oxalocrotonate tautomerase